MYTMQGKLFIFICVVALTKGVLGNDDPISICSRSCMACKCLPTEPPTICSAEEAEGTLLPHENCNQFYICNHGSKVTFDCPSSLFFNPETEQCDYPHNVICSDKIIPDEEDKNEESEDPISICSRSCKDCKCLPTEPPTVCSAEEAEGTLLPHENCNQFYICNHGSKVTFDCPSKLFFNPVTEQCDYPQNVVCGGESIPDKEDSKEVSDSNEINDHDTATEGVEEEKENATEEVEEEMDTATDRVEEEIYTSTEGVEEEIDTATEGVEEEIKDHSDEERSDENSDNDVQVELEINLFENAKAKCTETESDGHMSVHENCHQFYVCLKHEPAVLSCPLGLLYDVPTQTCKWPKDVQCEKRNLVAIEL